MKWVENKAREFLRYRPFGNGPVVCYVQNYVVRNKSAELVEGWVIEVENDYVAGGIPTLEEAKAIALMHYAAMEDRK